MVGDHQRGLYDKPAIHTAIRKLIAAVEPLDISMAEASLRWLVFHSSLQEGDGIILGASRVAQLEKNSQDIAKGRLPEELVKVFEDAWKDVRDDVV